MDIIAEYGAKIRLIFQLTKAKSFCPTQDPLLFTPRGPSPKCTSSICVRRPTASRCSASRFDKRSSSQNSSARRRILSTSPITRFRHHRRTPSVGRIDHSIHHVTASACRMTNPLRFIPTADAMKQWRDFEERQNTWFERIYDIPPSESLSHRSPPGHSPALARRPRPLISRIYRTLCVHRQPHPIFRRTRSRASARSSDRINLSQISAIYRRPQALARIRARLLRSPARPFTPILIA